jgi:GT2 family glycosyltransferase
MEKFTLGIPVYNTLNYLKITLDSIKKNTINNYELIIIDDCSDKETKDYLSSLDKSTKIITNDKIEGFPHNCNLLINNSTCEKIIILNSDVYCPYGWDTKLLLALNKYDIVGPSTCHAYGDQLIKEIKQYKNKWNFEEIEQYSVKNSNKYLNEVKEINTVSGFCFCFNRKLINKIGNFDEQFGRGSFEESDFCLRAKKAGYRCVWVKGCYVHHYGHISFSSIGNSEELWKNNEKLFFKKHNVNKVEP